MKKLELKHLAPYLPYGLTGLWSNGKKRIYRVTNVCVAGDGNISFGHSLKTRYKHEINRPLSEFKPLLIPMSELTDTLYDWLEQDFVPFDCRDFLNTLEIAPMRTPLFICDKIFELHGDLFGLIPAGLALNKLEYI